MTDLPKWAVERGREIVVAVLEGSAGAYSIKQTPEETAAELVAFVARALAVAAGPKWQPIETAPRDRPILLRVGKIVGSGEYRPLTRWSDERGFCFDGATLPSGATHWTDLPAPPEVG